MEGNKSHRTSTSSEDSKNIVFSQKASRFLKEKCDLVRTFNRQSRTIEQPWSATENVKNVYAILPPMEKFMDVEKEELQQYIWNGFQRGDLAVVRITSIRDQGFTAVLVSLDGGKSKDISCIVHAWCPVSEIPKKTNHEDVLLQFSNGDLVRCAITEVGSQLEVSLRKQFASKYNVCLGKIEEEDLPKAYQRSLSSNESYENILKKSVGFINPSSVEYLMKRLGVSRGPEMSLMTDLRSIVISEREYADSLRKQQSRKVAELSVMKGIKRFKNMEYEVALQSFNYALDMDSENVDGLVARGALYANRNCFLKAIRDFEVALKIEPYHRNAKKYLTEVLVERAKQIESQIEDVQQIKEVKRCYQKALVINPDCEEAKLALGEIEKKQKESETKGSSSDSGSHEEYVKTAKKLKHILKNDAVLRKRTHSQTKLSQRKDQRRRDSSSERHDSSTSSSSSSSSSSTSSSSTSSSSSDVSIQKKRSKRSSSNSSKNSHKHKSKSKKIKESLKLQDCTKRERHTSSKRHSLGSSRNFDASFDKRRSMPVDTKRSHSKDHSITKRRTSYTEEPARAVIYSSHNNKKPLNSTLRRSSSDIKNITKDNFKDILQEISKFETTSKTKR